MQQPKTINPRQHYQLIENHLTRLIFSTKKLLEVTNTFDVLFSTNDYLHNVVSKAVLPDAPAGEILQNDVIGTELFETFVSDRLHRDVSVWAPLRKRYLKNFKGELNRTIKSTVQGKVVQLREEKTSRKRLKINLEFYL